MSGTAFWTSRLTGRNSLQQNAAFRLPDFNDENKWYMDNLIGMRYNTALFYNSSLFHSRYPFEAFGDCPENGRLIAVAFFTPENK
jgi:hypothetical protein